MTAMFERRDPKPEAIVGKRRRTAKSGWIEKRLAIVREEPGTWLVIRDDYILDDEHPKPSSTGAASSASVINKGEKYPGFEAAYDIAKDGKHVELFVRYSPEKYKLDIQKFPNTNTRKQA